MAVRKDVQGPETKSHQGLHSGSFPAGRLFRYPSVELPAVNGHLRCGAGKCGQQQARPEHAPLHDRTKAKG